MLKPLWTATVALVGFESEDLAHLTNIFGRDECQLAANCKWKICPSDSAESTMAVLWRESISIVLCDHDTSPGAWKQLLEQFAGFPRPPLLIVASRLADDRLWTEALHLGAHDVLCKPFAAAEVIRTAGAAYQRWQRHSSAPPLASHMVA